MCPSKEAKNKVKIGEKCMVKWLDKKLYIADVLKRGGKFYYY